MPTFGQDLEALLTPFRVVEQTFDLGEGLQVQNRTAGGEVIRSGGAARLWRGKLVLGRVRNDQVAGLEAVLHTLRGPGAWFTMRDYRRSGTRAAQILAFNGTARDILTLQGLPAGAVVAPGDYIAWDYSGRRALHQVHKGSTANSSGNTGNIEIVPTARIVPSAGLTVAVGSARFRAVMVPGSLDMGQSRGIWHEGISFDWSQTLRENP